MAAVRLEAIRALTDVTDVLVTGATGFAGSHLIDLVQPSGASITGWRRTGHPRPEANPSVQWQAVDLLDKEAVRRAIAEARPSKVSSLKSFEVWSRASNRFPGSTTFCVCEQTIGLPADIVKTVLALGTHPERGRDALARLDGYLAAAERLWDFVDTWRES